MVFKSKMDGWMAIPIWMFIVLFFRMLYTATVEGSIIGMILAIIFVCFVGAIWFHTRYIIKHKLLIIRYVNG